jgi:hypothetical protein
MPSHVDSVLTSIARKELPDCYVRIHVQESGERHLSLHAGNVNIEREVRPTAITSKDPLRIALERLLDDYWNRRRPGWEPEAA